MSVKNIKALSGELSKEIEASGHGCFMQGLEYRIKEIIKVYYEKLFDTSYLCTEIETALNDWLSYRVAPYAPSTIVYVARVVEVLNDLLETINDPEKGNPKEVHVESPYPFLYCITLKDVE